MWVYTWPIPGSANSKIGNPILNQGGIMTCKRPIWNRINVCVYCRHMALGQNLVALLFTSKYPGFMDGKTPLTLIIIGFDTQPYGDLIWFVWLSYWGDRVLVCLNGKIINIWWIFHCCEYWRISASLIYKCIDGTSDIIQSINNTNTKLSVN